MRILLVDDEHIVLTIVRRILNLAEFDEVDICDNARDAITLIKNQDYDIVLLDLIMPEMDGLQVLEETKPFKPSTEFIILTAVDDHSTTVKAMRLGAYDYLVKPVKNERLLLTVQKAFEHKGLMRGLAGTSSSKAQVPSAFAEIITQNPRMKELLAYTAIMAGSGNPVLITGESGTGKELLARGIHKAGLDPKGPFVAVNMASIPESLFESQFFGHVKGAFTGAAGAHAGYFEQANGGTIFLDEIGELAPSLQAKLLRVVEEKTITKLGAVTSIQVSIRIVSATNSDLDRSCREKNFRLDLMHRLKSAHIHLPPLREREDDIPLLASHFLKKACLRYDKTVQGFSRDALEMLVRKEYPGNVRELAQYVERAVLLAQTGVIMPTHLGEDAPSFPLHIRSLCSFKENYEAHAAYVLTQTGGNKRMAAKILGVTARQLNRIIAQMEKDPRWKPLLHRDI